MRSRQEEGVALLTVLLLVAVMSAFAVAILDDIRFGLRRTANAESIAQARWYAIGAETLARSRLADLTASNLSAIGERTFNFPIEEGSIHAALRDGSTCFNLNSVVEGAGETYRRRDLGAAQFVALLDALGVSPGRSEALVGALIDWIDSDGIREPAGAEDEAYARGARPYRTSGTLLAEASELRAIKGFDAELYARLRPFVCALPTPELSPINVNALAPRDGVLVVMLTNGAMSLSEARRVIAGRPAGGWSDPMAFWRSPEFGGDLPDSPLDQVGTRPQIFALETRVSYRDAAVVATSLLEETASGKIALVARRWTIDE